MSNNKKIIHKYCEYGAYVLELSPEVISPGGDTEKICNIIEGRCSKSRVGMVVGCGAGLIPLVLSGLCEVLYATDINPHAVELTRSNLAKNNVSNCEVAQGDLFGPFSEMQFDLIVANLPQMPVALDQEQNNLIALAHDGGKSGREVLDKFIVNLPKKLTSKRGKAIFSNFDYLGLNQTAELLDSLSLKGTVLEQYKHKLGEVSYHVNLLGEHNFGSEFSVSIIEASV